MNFAASQASVTPLVGRAPELAALRAAVSRAAAGGGATWSLVVGPRGAGRTRVLEEIAGEARRAGALVLHGRGDPRRQTQGFGVLIELLREAAGLPVGGACAPARAALLAWCAEVAPGLGEDDAICLGYLLGIVDHAEPALELAGGDPRRIRDATWAAATHLILAAAAARPVVVLVDDLHEADVATAELLAHWSRRLADLRLAVVASAIPGDVGDAGWARVPLGPLDLASMAAIVASVAARPPGDAQVAASVETAGGSPLVALELGRLTRARGAAPPPPAGGHSLEDLLSPQIAGLPAHERAALDASAVLGELVWEGALAALGVPDPAAALGALSARGLAERASDLRFPEERAWRIRPRIWAEISGRAQGEEAARAAHLAAGRWLRDRGEDPAIVGEHLARGGAGEEAAAALEAAAAAAERAGAFPAAQALALRAAAIGEPGARRLARRLLGVRQGPTSAALPDALRAEAEALCAEAGDDALGREAAVWGGATLFLLGETGEARIARTAEAARRAAALGEVSTAAWGLRHASFALAVTARIAEAEALIREITERVGELDPEAGASVAHARGVVLLSSGRSIEAAEALGLAFDLSSATNHRAAAAEHGSDYAYTLLVAGDLAGSFDVLEHAFEMAEEAGTGHDQILQNVLEHEAWVGPHARSGAPIVGRAFARARATREADQGRYALCLRGGLLIFSACWPDDARALPPGEVLARSPALLAASEAAAFWELVSEVHCAAALALSRLGRHEEALRRAEAALAVGERQGLSIYPTHAAFAAFEAARALGRAAEARAALERAASQMRRDLELRAGTRFQRLFLEGYALHRRLLAACAELGLPSPAARVPGTA